MNVCGLVGTLCPTKTIMQCMHASPQPLLIFSLWFYHAEYIFCPWFKRLGIAMPCIASYFVRSVELLDRPNWKAPLVTTLLLFSWNDAQYPCLYDFYSPPVSLCSILTTDTYHCVGFGCLRILENTAHLESHLMFALSPTESVMFSVFSMEHYQTLAL